MNFENNKYIDIIFSFVAIAYIVWLVVDYDSLVYDDNMPTGKAAKKMIILLILLDKAVGKFWTIIILSLLAIPFIYRSFKSMYIENKRKKEMEE
jgi:TRAP-type uncharacterized transport system fused permease subunit